MNKTYIFLLVLVFIVGGIVGYGLHTSPKLPFVGAVGPAGEQQSSPTSAQISFNGQPLGVSTTTTLSVWGSILNTGSRDRVLTAEEVAVFGLETNNTITLYVSTSTAPATTTNNNFTSVVLSGNANTQWSHSTLASGATSTPVVWPAGTYINFIASSTATTTTVSGSGIGTIKFNQE